MELIIIALPGIGATLLYLVLSALGVLKPPRNAINRTMHDRCAVYPDLPPVSYDAVEYWERRGVGEHD